MNAERRRFQLTEQAIANAKEKMESGEWTAEQAMGWLSEVIDRINESIDNPDLPTDFGHYQVTLNIEVDLDTLESYLGTKDVESFLDEHAWQSHLINDLVTDVTLQSFTNQPEHTIEVTYASFDEDTIWAKLMVDGEERELVIQGADWNDLAALTYYNTSHQARHYVESHGLLEYYNE